MVDKDCMDAAPITELPTGNIIELEPSTGELSEAGALAVAKAAMLVSAFTNQDLRKGERRKG